MLFFWLLSTSEANFLKYVVLVINFLWLHFFHLVNFSRFLWLTFVVVIVLVVLLLSGNLTCCYCDLQILLYNWSYWWLDHKTLVLEEYSINFRSHQQKLFIYYWFIYSEKDWSKSFRFIIYLWLLMCICVYVIFCS